MIETLQSILREHLSRERGTPVKRRDLPKLGHGGTLDPFATGLLVVCVGDGVKLSRYFLGSDKRYRGTIRFGETTVPGDPTDPISDRCEHVPASLAAAQEVAHAMTRAEYMQTPPMHSAKKQNGKPLYELARQGVEVSREATRCHLRQFDLSRWSPPTVNFDVTCSSGTYIRVLAQDLGLRLNTVAMLNTLERTQAGPFLLEHAMPLDEIAAQSEAGAKWELLGAWISFDRLLSDVMPRVDATESECLELTHGKQHVAVALGSRVPPQTSTEMPLRAAIYSSARLVAVIARETSSTPWHIERGFSER